eukprot:CAMPEP_0114596220 /NCGR_PEP_ID=MMETSP0125-20121206/18193_1 /TAXON_ID=485358 ORGANISM="Aristerostoma sp., Strain ATCC 50986" /NCGR_SAMPLE_ID=MMETSP0125 /ASSEMBLY_ACC=CAM_ASM_000245 /LENGTH=60 /DNA_ID=CAMNT_0001798939 /DNA_START=110 /DNA_END=292 /DNA_ORIENTATION=+
MEKISKVMRDTIDHKLVDINAELDRLKVLYIENKEKMKESKKVLKKSLKEVQQEELKRGQ